MSAKIGAGCEPRMSNESMSRMPVYFLSHGGGPWPYVDGMRQLFARTEREFKALLDRLPAKPKAVLVITGHHGQWNDLSQHERHGPRDFRTRCRSI